MVPSARTRLTGARGRRQGFACEANPPQAPNRGGAPRPRLAGANLAAMPTYQYVCRDCEHRFEAVQSIHDPNLTECPECGGAIRRVLSPVGVTFKGSGFYRTDSREAKKKSGASSAGKPAADGAAIKGGESGSSGAGGSTGSDGGSDGGKGSSTAGSSGSGGGSGGAAGKDAGGTKSAASGGTGGGSARSGS